MRQVPAVAAELGPGDSLGIGLAALLSGCKTYYAFDVVHLIRNEQNLQLFEEIVDLFKTRSAIPDDSEFPHLFPRLEAYAFPRDILNEEILAESLAPERLNKTRVSLAETGREGNGAYISYFVPWNESSVIQESSIDFILSQAVLEHVDDLPGAYASMFRWLKPGGYVSHEIDFKSHGITTAWDGHRKYSDFLWRIIRGNRVYLINREPASAHIRCAQDAGLVISNTQVQSRSATVTREKFAPRFRVLEEEDLTTSSMYMIAQKGKVEAPHG